MKYLFALAVMLCLSPLMVAQDNDRSEGNENKDHFKFNDETDKDDKDHFRFIQEGEFASLSGFSVTSGHFFFQVSRGFSTTGGTSASLQYSAFSKAPDSSTITITNVFGPIPSSAFTGETTQHLALDIDTGTLDPTKFSSETCTFVPTTLRRICGPGPAGLIHLEFRENGARRTIVDLKQTTFLGPVTTLIHQKSDNSTADFQGSLFGTPVADFSGASASVGVNHQSTLKISHD
jgi:hypothetical protein